MSETQGYGTLYFLSKLDTTVHLTVLSDTAIKNYNIKIKGSSAANISVFSTESKASTISAEGDHPFTIVAALRQLPVLNGTNATDFGCFIPTSIIPSETLHKPYTIDLLTGTYYLFTPDNFFGDEFDVEIEGSYNVREAWTIATNVSQQLHYIDQRQFGKYVILQGSSAVSISHVLRYGDCGRKKNEGYGAFLDNVVSEVEYVTGTTGYVVSPYESQVTIIGDELTRRTSIDNGEAVSPLSFSPCIRGKNYLFCYSKPAGESNIFSWFSAKGRYTLYVCTSAAEFSYGYTPRVSVTAWIVSSSIIYSTIRNTYFAHILLIMAKH
ncbi:unnamed protein product [Enterobius vermicularis]|uniref:IgGFc_binding domain-containing protein n=1 Tax=Enterobius vermicularis TaxID=51028 RepID=A0A0N4VFA1_ENTVE|nr:unnamed protein product [Enterobius vermicularis]